MLLVGIDWAERHHDVCVMATDGSVLARERITDGMAGVARLHELIASLVEEPAEVVVGIETDRGLLVGALVAAGYQVIAVNPLAASRYRERHTISGAKSEPEVISQITALSAPSRDDAAWLAVTTGCGVRAQRH